MMHACTYSAGWYARAQVHMAMGMLHVCGCCCAQQTPLQCIRATSYRQATYLWPLFLLCSCRKWGLPQSDMNIMFRSLSRLCDVLMNFFSEVSLCITPAIIGHCAYTSLNCGV